jgi:hypothetical protein
MLEAFCGDAGYWMICYGLGFHFGIHILRCLEAADFRVGGFSSLDEQGMLMDIPPPYPYTDRVLALSQDALPCYA